MKVRELFNGRQNFAVLDELGIDPDEEVETVRYWLLLGKKTATYEPRDPGPGPHGSLAGPPEDWYRFFLSWLRDTV